MSADATVRLAAPNDAPALGALQAVTWASSYADLIPADLLEQCTPAVFGKAWRESLAQVSDDSITLVATAGPQVVGTIAAAPSSDPDLPRTYEIVHLMVGSEHRTQGHASRLINALVEHLPTVEQLAIWVPLPLEEVRAFVQGSGLAPDGAYRDRLLAPGVSLREVRLTGLLPAHPDAPAASDSPSE